METSKEFYNLSTSINKALNPMEAPLKMKHARSVIITTHRTKESKCLWVIIMRQPLMEHRFTAWKFCHLLHKVLREGHPSAIKQSQTHKKMILEMGKLWGHLQDGVGSCIQAYTKLLVSKLDFHGKNDIFPGSLLIDFYEIERYAGDDINVYFQLCVEIFDYLDDINDMQLKVFESINTYRMSSMTPQGQCRLAPLITLIQDSNPLYDISVRIMFKLHDKLPIDILAGHRDRFRNLFLKLKYFYDNVRPLQYFADLIQVPHLPDSAPNFTSQVDFGSYSPPVMFVQPDPEPVMENLVDATDLQDQNQHTKPALNTENDDYILLQDKVKNAEMTINDLHMQLISMKDAHHTLEGNYEKEVKQLREQTALLSSELSQSNATCSTMQAQLSDLQLKLTQNSALLQKEDEKELKVKISEEKFNKLKTMYSQIRDEHINLLRQTSDSTKLLNKEKQYNKELQMEVSNLKSKIDNLEQCLKDEGTTQSANIALKESINEITNKCTSLEKSYADLKQNFHESMEQKDLQIERLEIGNIRLEEITSELAQKELKVSSLELSLNAANDTITKSKDKYDSLKIQCIKESEEQVNSINNLNKEIEKRDTELYTLRERLLTTEANLQENIETNKKSEQENDELKVKMRELYQKMSALSTEMEEETKKVCNLLSDKDELQKMYENAVTSTVHCVLKSTKSICISKANEKNESAFDKCIQYIQEMETDLSEFSSIYKNYFQNQNEIKDLIFKCIILAYTYTMLHEQISLIYNTTTDLEKAEDILKEVTPLNGHLLKLFELILNVELVDKVEDCIQTLRDQLCKMNSMLKALISSVSGNIDIGDLVETELLEMDKAIEEAADKFAQLLQHSRIKDDGIKLEVNEKVLDACTTLMKCIKLLIQKSKTLQEEIIRTGRGGTSVKEFYKRNSQWTEGLISAAKSVAKGANLLVEAANKAVTNESNQYFEIIVAAQAIAAYTAQLVIASKVKAPKDSKKLIELTGASRSVSQATGAVVATVKDCNQNLEQSQDLDFSKLTTSQVKTMEIEINVKILELEQALQSERLRLSSFRKKNYKNTED